MKKLSKKWLFIGLGVLLLILVVAYFGVSWYISNIILSPDHKDPENNHKVLLIEDQRVTLNGPTYKFDGLVGAHIDDQTTIFNAPITSNTENEEAVRTVSSGKIPNVDEEFFGDIWINRKSNPKEILGLEYEEVKYNDTNPALFVPADSQKWIIGVHGINGAPEELLRYMSAANTAGYNFLSITYQNDPAASPSSDGYYHYGDTEWRDVEDAVNYVKSKKASEIALFGVSLGGSIVSNFVKNSSSSEDVSKIVFDSPSLDWKDTFHREITKRGLPGQLTWGAYFVAGLRSGNDFDRVSAINFPDKFTQEVLIFHSSDDDIIPFNQSVRFTGALGDKARLVNYDRGLHTLSWNYEKEKYEQELTSFLQK